MKIRTNLPLLLTTSGVSLGELERRTGISRCYLSWYKAGRMIPSDAELLEICQVLNVTVDMLYPDPDLRKALAE